MRILSGDDDGYRKLCAGLAERYGTTRDSQDAFWAGYIVSLAPGAGVDAALPVRWEERAVAATAPGGAPGAERQLHALGLAHYRAGQFEEAARRYRESMKVASPAMPPAEPLNWLGLALAYHRLKQPDEARRCLDKATAWMKQANADRPEEEVESPPLTMTFSDWLEYQILRREAEAALMGPAPKPEK